LRLSDLNKETTYLLTKIHFWIGYLLITGSSKRTSSSRVATENEDDVESSNHVDDDARIADTTLVVILRI